MTECQVSYETGPNERIMEIDKSEVFDIGAFEDFKLPNGELKPPRQASRGSQTAWINIDESGNWDPESAAQGGRRQRHERAQARASRMQYHNYGHDEGSACEEMKASSDTSPGSAEITRLIIALKFTSQDGQMKFKQRLIRLETQDRAEQATYWLRNIRAAPTYSFGTTVAGYEVAELPDDLTGYPVARGCYSCAALSNSDPNKPGSEHCSLLDDERSWPCDNCYENEHDCEIITAPARKTACEACKDRREACSFVNTRNHGKSCHQCARFGHPCVAGPLTEYIRPRIRYDRNWEEDPFPRPKQMSGEVRQPEACGECRDAGRECSYQADVDGHHRTACIDCLAGNLPCTILSSRTSKPLSDATLPKKRPPREESAIVSTWTNAPKPSPRTNAPKPSPRTDAPKPSPRTNAPKPSPRLLISSTNVAAHPALFTVSTSFVHPIIFNCDDPPSSQTP